MTAFTAGPAHHALSALLGRLQAFFARQGMPAYLVGGLVRDALRGRAGAAAGRSQLLDVDLVVQGDAVALARQMARELDGTFVLLDPEHQVARVVVRTVPRSPASPPRAYVDLARLRGDLDTDLALRDFTVNAIALPLEAWHTPAWPAHLHDPHGGASDLAAGVLRAVAPGVFRDDPARLLRAVRLATELGLAIEPATAALVRQSAPLLDQVSGERLREEFLRTLARPGAFHPLALMDDLGLLVRLLPPLELGRGCIQPPEHHYDVLRHNLATVEGVEYVTFQPGLPPQPQAVTASASVLARVPWSDDLAAHFDGEWSDGHTHRTFLKLGALLHDVAKPHTRTVEPDGRIRFLGHPTVGVEVLRPLLRRLRLSSKGIGLVALLVEHHLRPTQMAQGAALPTPRAVFRFFRDLGDAALDTLFLALGDYLAAKGPQLDLEDWQRHATIVGHILQVRRAEQAPQQQSRLLTGHDLMQRFGLPPGPLLGQVLSELQEAQAAGEVRTRDEALAWAQARLARAGQEPP